MAYLDSDRAARFLGFVRREADGVDVPDRKALREYLTRKGVPTKRRGRAVVVDERDLEASLTPGPVPRDLRVVRRRSA